MIRAPELIQSTRLILRRPRLADAETVFARYSADREVTRYVGWPAHDTVDDTRAFVAFSDGQWAQWPAGPYLAWARSDGSLLGASGLMFETPQRAATGYVFARDAWGKGFATEALTAMMLVALVTGVRRLYALCHAEHRASARVLEKCGFACEGTLRQYVDFPNLRPGHLQDVLCYSTILEIASGTSRGNCS